jgi:hypothetical protein
MKTWILAMAMMMGVAMNAQPGEGRHDRGSKDGEHHGWGHRDNFTPEQRTELRVKHLTLALDLTDKQQKDMQALLLTQEKQKGQFMAQHEADRDAGKKPTEDERVGMLNKRLDAQISMKRDMKKILTAEQYQKFESQKEKRHEKVAKHEKNFKKHDRR